MTEAAEALVALLAQPDPPDLCTPDGVGRSSRQTVPGKDDRYDVLDRQPSVWRAWQLIERDNERLQ